MWKTKSELFVSLLLLFSHYAPQRPNAIHRTYCKLRHERDEPQL